MPAPYQFDSYRSPYANTIASLLENQGQIAAEGARARGQQAQQIAQSVNAGVQGVAAIPQQVRSEQAQQLELQNAQQRNQIGQAQIASIQRDAQGRALLSKLVASGADNETIAKQLTSAGFPEQGEAYLKTATNNAEALDKLAESKKAHERQFLETVGDLAFRAKDAQGFASSVQLLAKHGLMSQQEADQITNNPDNAANWAQERTQLMSFSPEYKAQQSALQKPMTVGPDSKIVIPATKEVIATGEPKPSEKQSKSVLLDGKPAEVVFDPKVGKYFDSTGVDVSARVKPIPSVAAVMLQSGTGLSDTAMDQAAQKYLDTGQLPPGYGAAGIQRQTAVMNRAAQMDPKAALARNAATYKADSSNLVNLQRTEGSLSAFENAAGKNIDQFLSLSSKLPDSGVPWLNTPIRNLSDKLVGNEWLPAVQAARKIALREVARVTNDPKLSGQITDSARADINDMANGEATIAQMLRVFPVLKQDMTNVHTGLNEEITAVKSRMSGQNPGTTIKVGHYTVTVKP